MNTNMKTLQDFDRRQKLAQFGIQAMGNVVTAGVVVFLVLAWVLTSPLIRMVDLVAGNGKEKTKDK
jgi:hypothetical protein